MWLSAEYLIGLLSVIQVLHFTYALDIKGSSDPCIAKILSCDWYRQPFYLHNKKDIRMFTKIEDLNKACKKQTAYMRCIVRAEKFCEQKILLPIAKEMINSRRFAADICRPTSPWQQLYLKEASCLNAYSREAFIHCGDKLMRNDHLNIHHTSEIKCKHRRAIIDCSATELQGKCGYYAGNVWKRLIMFHSLTDYKCLEFTSEEMNEYAFSSTPEYDITEAIFNIVEAENFDNEATEADYVNTNFEEKKSYNLESQISFDDSISEETYTIVDFIHPLTEESLMKTEYYTDSLDSEKEMQAMNTEPDKFKFPALPKYHYVHKNKTTFALYEDLKMGHMNYVGCGEAEFFWVILSPLKNKYCILTDLKSEYSEAVFKCTIRIDAPCSSELDDEDGRKMAEVFHRRYVITVITPPNNRKSEDMAIMNAHYLKLYPSPSMDTAEKKVNLWTAQANKDKIEQLIVGRKGFLELENDHSDVLYQQGNGSGKEWGKDTMNSPTHLPADEYESWDYHPLEKEDIYFPELLLNNVIYIEDDNGDLISLHDHRSPIYSKSVYQPHSLFRPRTGGMPSGANPQHKEITGQVSFPDVSQSSIFKERISEFQDEALVSKGKPNQQEYCSAEAPCNQNSEFISGFKTKPGKYRPKNIETLDTFEETNQLRQKISSSIKLNLGIDLKTFSISRDVYVVTPSTEIEVPKSTESSQAEERHKDEFVTDRSRYLPEQEDSNFKNMASDSRYVNPDCSSSEISAPYSIDSKIDGMKPFQEYHIDAFTRPPYLYKHTDTNLNSRDSIYQGNLKTKPSSEIESLCEGYLAESIGNILKNLFEKTEKSIKRDLLDKMFTFLEKVERLFNL